MKKRIIALLLLLAALAGLLAGCGAEEAADTAEAVLDLIDAVGNTQDAAPQEDTDTPEDTRASVEDILPEETDTPAEDAGEPEETAAPEEEDAREICELPLADSTAINEYGAYSSPEKVAEYIHTYGKLPGNFITKNDARDLGWDNSRGNLWDVAPGKSIGGDRFGNYEGLLPEGRYRECDVNYTGGYRGAERLIYGEDGSVWYTNDHYQSFTQLY